MVGGSKGRGVVAAASYEARQYGVRSAMPASVARRLCPDGHFLPSRMARYREVSEHIFGIFAQYADAIEGVSLDEAYLDLSEHQLKTAIQIERFGRMLKRQIAKETGLTCSVGLSHNKLLAKIASDYDKPDGLVYLPLEAVERVIAPLPIRRLPGVGPKTAEKLHASGILTIGQIQRAQPELLLQLIGDGCSELIERSNGIDHRPVKPDRVRRSVSQESTFEKNITKIKEIEPYLKSQSEKVSERLVAKGLTAKSVHIKIRSGGFSTLTRSTTLAEPTQSALEIQRAATGLFLDWAKWHSSFAIRLIGVGVSVSTPAPESS